MRNAITIFLLIFITTGTLAQQRLVRKAQLSKNKGDYYGAILAYEEAIENGLDLDESNNLELADLYYALGNYEKSVFHYKSLSGLNSLTATDFFHYSHALEVMGETGLKADVLDRLKEMYPSDTRVKKLMDTDLLRNRSLFNDYHRLLGSIDNVIKVVDYECTTYGVRLGEEHDELVALNGFVPDSLIFADWNINQGGLAFINPDYLIVTLNLNRNGKLVYYENDRSTLHLYSLRRNELGEWSQPKYLPINIDGYNTANPAVSPDGAYLYFASDRPGGMGQSDLYRVSIIGNELFGRVEHLKEGINTEGRESYVFIDNEGIMYFSSDGYPGKGGLDVYAVDLNADEVNVLNMGHPINTVYDDFAYSRYGTKGYFSTNRDGHLTSWAYELTVPMMLTERLIKNTDLDLPEVVISEEPVQLKVAFEATVQQEKLSQLNSSTSSTVSSSSLDSLGDVNSMTNNIKEKQIKDEANNLNEQILELEKILNIKVEYIGQRKETGFRISILFDHNSSYLNKESMQNLKDLITLLNEKKESRILIEGHTDSTGENSYNNWLSERRTNRVRTYLVENQIPAERISTTSYGEEKPVDDNQTEEGRQANRGVYITIFLNSQR